MLEADEETDEDTQPNASPTPADSTEIDEGQTQPNTPTLEPRPSGARCTTPDLGAAAHSRDNCPGNSEIQHGIPERDSSEQLVDIQTINHQALQLDASFDYNTPGPLYHDAILYQREWDMSAFLSDIL